VARSSFTHTSETFTVTCTSRKLNACQPYWMKLNWGNASWINSNINHIADNFTNRTPLTMTNFTMMSVVTSNMRYSFCTLLLLFMGSFHRTGCTKTWPAQKLLIQVKLTGNPDSYVCEWLPLECMQTRVCWNSYTGTHTVPDSYSCLCERSLKVGAFTCVGWQVNRLTGFCVISYSRWCFVDGLLIKSYNIIFYLLTFNFI